MPSPRSTNSPAFTPPPQRSNTWLIVLLTSVLLVFVVAAGTVILWLSLRDKTNGPQDSAASQTFSNQSGHDTSSSNNGKSNNDTSASTPETSPSWKLVGVWRTNVEELGVNTEITYTFLADGSSKMVFKTAGKRQPGTDYGTWQYSEGILYEKFSNGVSGKGTIEWIDDDTFELTIVDNGVPAYNGLKRRYHRVN